MAVLPSLPHISVTVHNDGGELPEYPDAEPDAVEGLKSPSSVVVSNYIEAPSDGGPFMLNFGVEPPYKHGPHSILFVFEPLDADFTIKRVCDPGDLMDDELWEMELSGYAETSGRVPIKKCFQFSMLKILPGDGENDDLSDTERKNMEGVGILQIRVLLGKPMSKKKVNNPKQATDSFSGPIEDVVAPTTNIVTEKVVARKSLSLGMIYNDQSIDASGVGVDLPYTYIDGWDNPLAIFQFKYRSRADLQKLLLIEKSPKPEQLLRENQLPTPAASPVPSCSQSLALTWKEFEDLTFTEVRALARKQYASFDKLGADEIETLARKKHAEETAHANDGDALLSSVLYTPKTFEDLTFSQVRSLAKKQYKSFDELSVDEVEGLAKQGHSEAMALSQSITSGATDERNGSGKRKVSIKVEDADEDVVFVSATKKRK